MIETKSKSSSSEMENQHVKENKKYLDTPVQKDKMRKTLHALQPAATDKENLVGAGRKLRSESRKSLIPVKNAMSPKIKEDIKKTNDKIVVKKNTSPKDVPQKTKTETKKAPVEKKTGRVFKTISIQTESSAEAKVTADDLTSASPSKDYWKILAERRRIALEDALEENRNLVDENKILSDQIQVYKDMLDESRALVEVLQEMLGEDGNGIENSLNDSHL